MYEKTVRCTICGKEFTDEELVSAFNCPSCSTKNVPCNISEDVSVKINWHELHILVVWAERWARRIDENAKKFSTTTEPFNHLYTIMVIAERLQKQYPDKNFLTLFGEIRSLRKDYNIESDLDDDSKLNIDE